MIMNCKSVNYIDGSIEESSYEITEEQMNMVVSILDDLCKQCEDSPNKMIHIGDDIRNE